MKTCCVGLFFLIPWAFFVAAMDYVWGFPFGYVIVPIVIWWVTKRALRYIRMRFVLLSLIGSYGFSSYLAYWFDNDWGYFFKPLNLIVIVHTWSVVVLIGVLVIVINHRIQKSNDHTIEIERGDQ